MIFAIVGIILVWNFNLPVVVSVVCTILFALKILERAIVYLVRFINHYVD